MNKQEMAEWLAENLFSIQIIDGVWWFDKMPESDFRTRLLLAGTVEDYIELIYSSDGFFAVWDAVDERFRLGWTKSFKVYSGGKSVCTFDLWGQPSHCMGKGKDRYEAFYSAVHEAMK